MATVAERLGWTSDALQRLSLQSMIRIGNGSWC
jgi:hypothetical protein